MKQRVLQLLVALLAIIGLAGYGGGAIAASRLHRKTTADSSLSLSNIYGVSVPVKMHDNGDGTYSMVIYSSGGSGAVTQGTSPWVVSNGGTFPTQATQSDGADVTLGAKADAKSTATDTTPISAMSVWKQISASVQAPALPSGASTSAQIGEVQASPTANTLLDRLKTINTTLSNPIAVTSTTGNTITAWQGGAPWSVTQTGSNVEATLLSSAARTVLTDSADVSNTSSRGAYVFINVTAASGTGGLTVRFEWKDIVSGNYGYLNAAPTAITATGQYIYALGPGFTTTGGSVAQSTGLALPKTWRIEIAVGDSSSYTYSISYAYAG